MEGAGWREAEDRMKIRNKSMKQVTVINTYYLLYTDLSRPKEALPVLKFAS